jgi:hypothetical protein
MTDKLIGICLSVSRLLDFLTAARLSCRSSVDSGTPVHSEVETRPYRFLSAARATRLLRLLDPGNRRGPFADHEHDRIFVLGTVPVHLLPEMVTKVPAGMLRQENDDVGFCQIGKEAICFAARFNAAMRRQSDLVD